MKVQILQCIADDKSKKTNKWFLEKINKIVYSGDTNRGISLTTEPKYAKFVLLPPMHLGPCAATAVKPPISVPRPHLKMKTLGSSFQNCNFH
jgi:hypothetical protein